MRNKYLRVSNHGFVGLVDWMGDDASIAQMARVSYKKGTKSVSDDRNLIRFLKRHDHGSPLESGEVKFHINWPLFVSTQFLRHRTFSWNFESLRYSEPRNDFWVPRTDEVTLQSKTNKQGGDVLADDEVISDFIEGVDSNNQECLTKYTWSNDAGIARELSRVQLPVSKYTQCYAKVDVRNLFHCLKLRCYKAAQKQTRDYAFAMGQFCRELFPVAFEAWFDYDHTQISWNRIDAKIRRIWNELPLESRASDIYEEAKHIAGRREVDECLNKMDVFYSDNLAETEDTLFKLDHSKLVTPETLFS